MRQVSADLIMTLRTATDKNLSEESQVSPQNRNWIYLTYCKVCKTPLYLAETCFDRGQTFKATTTTEALARLAGLPSFLVFYKVDDNRAVESLRITQLTPIKGKETFVLPEGWYQVLELLQEQHDLVCTKKDRNVL